MLIRYEYIVIEINGVVGFTVKYFGGGCHQRPLQFIVKRIAHGIKGFTHLVCLFIQVARCVETLCIIYTEKRISTNVFPLS